MLWSETEFIGAPIVVLAMFVAMVWSRCGFFSMGWVSTMEFVGEIFNVEIVLWFYVWRTSNEVEREKREREQIGGERKKMNSTHSYCNNNRYLDNFNLTAKAFFTSITQPSQDLTKTFFFVPMNHRKNVNLG